MDRLKCTVKHLLGKKCLHLLELYFFTRYALFYRGDQRLCPCCMTHLSSFVPMTTASGTLPEVICPRCDSHPRHRHLWLYFLNARRELFEKKLRLLHLAPEFSFMRQFRRMQGLDYVTADLASPLADFQSDVCCLPFPDDSFDVILCSHVLEHVPDDRKAMSELCRVLKPGGWAVMQVPISNELTTTFEDARISTAEERERHFGQHDHVRLYGGDDFYVRLAQAGFSVNVVNFIERLDEETIKRYALDRQEIIYLCGKSCSGAALVKEV